MHPTPLIALSVGAVLLLPACREAQGQPPPRPSPAAFEWREPASLDLIPRAPVAGVVNGKRFTANDIYFQPARGDWTLNLVPSVMASPEGRLKTIAKDELTLLVPKDFPKRKTVIQQFDSAQLMMLELDDPKHPGQKRTVQAQIEFALEITDWAVEPYDAGKGFVQQGGKASGRVYVAYKWPGAPNESGVAGSFRDVLVRYWGEPNAQLIIR